MSLEALVLGGGTEIKSMKHGYAWIPGILGVRNSFPMQYILLCTKIVLCGYPPTVCGKANNLTKIVCLPMDPRDNKRTPRAGLWTECLAGSADLLAGVGKPCPQLLCGGGHPVQGPGPFTQERIPPSG